MADTEAALPSPPGLGQPRYWASWLAVGLIHLLGRLPFPLIWAMGQVIGRIGSLVARDRRAVARANLAICLPDTSTEVRERILRRHFGWLGVAALAGGVGWGISRRRLRRLVRLVGRERIDSRIEAGRPVILLAPHFVGLELGSAALAGLVHPGVYMYQRIRDPVMDLQVRRARSQYGSIAVERSDDLRPLVREIRRGTPFFYLPDQDAGRRGIFVPFCGRTASTVPTLGRLAAMTGAVVIPTFARFLPWGRGLEVSFDPPIEPFPSGDPEIDAARMNQVIESRIHTMPEQYFWVHRRFKTRPEGEDPIYPPRRRRRRKG